MWRWPRAAGRGRFGARGAGQRGRGEPARRAWPCAAAPRAPPRREPGPALAAAGRDAPRGSERDGRARSPAGRGQPRPAPGLPPATVVQGVSAAGAVPPRGNGAGSRGGWRWAPRSRGRTGSCPRPGLSGGRRCWASRRPRRVPWGPRACRSSCGWDRAKGWTGNQEAELPGCIPGAQKWRPSVRSQQPGVLPWP